MTSLFLVCFIVGLVIGVRAMLYGVERERRSTFAVAPDRIGAIHAPTAPAVNYLVPLGAAFLVGFGVAGYVTLRRTAEVGAALGIGAVTGMVLAVLASRLVRKAASFVPEHDPDDPRYVLQGHVARVTATIPPATEGEISYAVEGASHVVRARSLDGDPVAAGTEVVIERIENGVAFVEPWAEVEQRL
jgi:membrane protein implicated in regulation of membrane protease activity